MLTLVAIISLPGYGVVAGQAFIVLTAVGNLLVSLGQARLWQAGDPVPLGAGSSSLSGAGSFQPPRSVLRARSAALDGSGTLTAAATVELTPLPWQQHGVWFPGNYAGVSNSSPMWAAAVVAGPPAAFRQN